MNEDERNIQCCLGKERGISLVKPNENLAKAYMAKAKESIEVMRSLQGKSHAWAASACYYSMYYSLYAIMMKIGVKSEIHSCSITFMRYARIDHQYYVTTVPKAEKLNELFDGAVMFYEKSLKLLSEIDENYVTSSWNKIRALERRKK